METLTFPAWLRVSLTHIPAFRAVPRFWEEEAGTSSAPDLPPNSNVKAELPQPGLCAHVHLGCPAPAHPASLKGPWAFPPAFRAGRREVELASEVGEPSGQNVSCLNHPHQLGGWMAGGEEAGKLALVPHRLQV